MKSICIWNLPLPLVHDLMENMVTDIKHKLGAGGCEKVNWESIAETAAKAAEIARDMIAALREDSEE